MCVVVDEGKIVEEITLFPIKYALSCRVFYNWKICKGEQIAKRRSFSLEGCRFESSRRPLG